MTIDDGSGPVRVVITPTAMEGRALAIGSSIIATGPLGQRDSSGTGLEGYRAYVTHAADLSVAPPTPTPSPSADGARVTPSPTRRRPDPESQREHSSDGESIAIR